MLQFIYQHWYVIGLLYLVVSLVAFIHMGVDKWKAKKDAWRVPERTLWLLAIFGGGVGAYLGMKAFRHKTLHTQFRYGFPALALIQLVILGFLLFQRMMLG